MTEPTVAHTWEEMTSLAAAELRTGRKLGKLGLTSEAQAALRRAAGWADLAAHSSSWEEEK